MSLFEWKDNVMLKCEDEDCGFMTGSGKEAMDHAYKTGHSLTGPGAIEGTTLTVTLERDEEDES
jgi:hypothetical protein